MNERRKKNIDVILWILFYFSIFALLIVGVVKERFELFAMAIAGIILYVFTIIEPRLNKIEKDLKQIERRLERNG